MASRPGSVREWLVLGTVTLCWPGCAEVLLAPWLLELGRGADGRQGRMIGSPAARRCVFRLPCLERLGLMMASNWGRWLRTSVVANSCCEVPSAAQTASRTWMDGRSHRASREPYSVPAPRKR